MENGKRPEDEIKFENLLKNPIRLFGLVYPYFALLVLIGGLYWIFNLDWAYLNSKAPQMLARDTVAEEISMKKGSIMEGVNVAEVGKSTPEMTAKGAELYKANCSSCHGEDGKGTGIAGAGLNPKPRDFHSAEGWKNGRKLSEMWKTLEDGIPGSGMVAYNYLPVSDRFALIHYIHSLMGDYPKDTDEELAGLDAAYKLSEGKISPSQIPVDMAMKKLSDESAKQNGEVSGLLKYLETHGAESGAAILKANADNYERIAISLKRSNLWMNGESDFIAEIASNINNNGFKSAVLRLGNEDLQNLHAFLVRAFSNNSASI